MTNTPARIRAGFKYLLNDGFTEAWIAGPAKCAPFDGLAVFYSVQGDWFLEDGRRLGLRADLDGATTRMVLSADNWRSINLATESERDQ
jgi:hypothetical protein